jgi:hypothetical protein
MPTRVPAMAGCLRAWCKCGTEEPTIGSTESLAVQRMDEHDRARLLHLDFWM